jgi:hypothetical protein
MSIMMALTAVRAVSRGLGLDVVSVLVWRIGGFPG